MGTEGVSAQTDKGGVCPFFTSHGRNSHRRSASIEIYCRQIAGDWLPGMQMEVGKGEGEVGWGWKRCPRARKEGTSSLAKSSETNSLTKMACPVVADHRRRVRGMGNAGLGFEGVSWCESGFPPAAYPSSAPHTQLPLARRSGPARRGGPCGEVCAAPP